MSKKKSDDLEEVVPAATEAPPPIPVTNPGFQFGDSRISKLLASDAMAKLQKAHGKNILARSSEHFARRMMHIPTGIHSLDLALEGGFAAGRLHTIYGHQSTGKTTLLMKMLAMAQLMCGECWGFPDSKGKCECKKSREMVAAYIDVEGTYNEKWAMNHGVDPNRLMISKTEYAEQALDIGEMLLRSHEVDIVAMDSLAFLTPAAEIEKSTVENLVGAQARAVGKGIRKFVSALNAAGNKTGRRPTVFFTNQIRMKVGVMFGNPETLPAGLAPGFAATTEIRLNAPKYKLVKEKKAGDEEKEEKKKKSGEEEESESANGHPLWADMSFTVAKNKAGMPKVAGSYRMLLAASENQHIGDVVDDDSLMGDLERYGLLTKVSDGWDLIGEPFKTKKDIEERLVKDKMFKLHTRTDLFKVVFPENTVEVPS